MISSLSCTDKSNDNSGNPTSPSNATGAVDHVATRMDGALPTTKDQVQSVARANRKGDDETIVVPPVVTAVAYALPENNQQRPADHNPDYDGANDVHDVDISSPCSFPDVLPVAIVDKNKRCYQITCTFNLKIMLCILLAIVLMSAMFVAGLFCGSGNCTRNVDDNALSSTERLYEAVDEYVLAEDPSSSNAAARYGYPIGRWDVSRIRDFTATFSYHRHGDDRFASFNEDLSRWNVSSAESMAHMFRGSNKFNGDLSAWDVRRVADMSQMFSGTESFNGDISQWRTSRVEDMSGMFDAARMFNGDLSEWDVSRVTTMERMFTDSYFNGDVSKWDVRGVIHMSAMFHLAKIFDGDLSNWDVRRVRTMDYMFALADNFNGNIANWEVSRVVTMERMFGSAGAFNQNLCPWRSQISVDCDLTLMFRNTLCLGEETPTAASGISSMCHLC